MRRTHRRSTPRSPASSVLHVEEGIPWDELAVVVRRQGAHVGSLLRALDDAGVPRALPESGMALTAEPATFPYVLALRWLIADAEAREQLVESVLTSDLVRLSPAAARGLINSGGTYSVLVMAEDSEGAISSELFSVTVGFLAPTLTITQLPFTVLPGGTASTPEGQQVNVAGTVNFPANPDGNYSDLTRLVVDWGDGGVLQKMYPCKAGSDPGVVADASCIFDTTNREYVELNVVPVPGSPDLAHGPWPFFFSHKYAFSPDHPLDPIPSGITHGAYDAQSRIKVYAVTTRGIWSQVERVNFTISNVPPALDLRPVCPVVPVAAPTCVGDFREVADGQALTLNARIFDVLEANHFIKVLWGDGTSSELQAGCYRLWVPQLQCVARRTVADLWGLPEVLQTQSHVSEGW